MVPFVGKEVERDADLIELVKCQFVSKRGADPVQNRTEN